MKGMYMLQIYHIHGLIETKIRFNVKWLKRKCHIWKKDLIKEAILSLNYPIYHLDFETFPCPLPRFKGEKPYTQSLFQYSIHIESKPGVCDKDKDNYGFIAKTHDDQRRALVEGMLDIIKPDGGSIMVYNQSFEQTRLKEMAELFPEHKERLLDMVDRLVDLMHFVRGNKKILYQFRYR